jgi:hypothetical protein
MLDEKMVTIKKNKFNKVKEGKENPRFKAFEWLWIIAYLGVNGATT